MKVTGNGLPLRRANLLSSITERGERQRVGAFLAATRMPYDKRLLPVASQAVGHENSLPPVICGVTPIY